MRRPGILSKFRKGFKKGYVKKHTLRYIEALLEDVCPYCTNEKCSTFDHVVPHATLRKMGERKKDTWRNLTGSCRKCNEKRKDVPLIEWMRRQHNGPAQQNQATH